MMSAIEMVMTVPSFDSLTEEKLTKLSEVYETKAALLALMEKPENVKVIVSEVRSVGHKLALRDSINEGCGMYGPSQHRRLGTRWDDDAVFVNDVLQEATGYELAELTNCKIIERCMQLVGPTSHPALYPALMKLYRLQIEIEQGRV